MEFSTIYFTPIFNAYKVDLVTLSELFHVDIAIGDYGYINVYTIDRSIIDSIVDELGHDNVTTIVYP